MRKLDGIELRSEELKDILTVIPHWMIRWGNTIIFIIIIMLFVFSWIIQYPELVKAEVTITTVIPPEKIIAQNSGKIEHIFVQNQKGVQINQPLAILENSASFQDMFLLKSILDSIDLKQQKITFPIFKTANLRLGVVGSVYAIFEKEYLAYQMNSNFLPYDIDKRAQAREKLELDERLNLLKSQNEIAKQERKLKMQELNRYKTLFNKGIISTQELETKSLDYLQQEKALNSLFSQISQTRSELNELTRDNATTILKDARDDLSLYKNLMLSYNELKKNISEWELTYVVKSSTAGQVSFLKIWNENQRVNQGDEMFVVVPDTQNGFIVKMKAPALNSGKLKVGQIVNIKLYNYPDNEFGVLKGKIESIALTPNQENNILIDVKLTNGLNTSFNKKILFQQEMIGTADIITEELRLIERLLYQFRDFFKR